MSAINSINSHQPINSRSRTRRNRRNHVIADTLLPTQLLRRPETSGVPLITQTLERPQQTGILWEPGRLHPPRLRRAPGTPAATYRRPHNHIQQQSQPQPRNFPSPLAQGTLSDTKFPTEDADTFVIAREARMAEYLSSWDKTWAIATANLSETILDHGIGNMTLDEPRISNASKTAPIQDLIGSINEAIYESDPQKSPGDSDGGVAIPEKTSDEPDPCLHPTAAMQLEELKAKIPWLTQQRTIDGAGWRQLEEYYWGDSPKDAVP